MPSVTVGSMKHIGLGSTTEKDLLRYFLIRLVRISFHFPGAETANPVQSFDERFKSQE